jgi:hypothetical protein
LSVTYQEETSLSLSTPETQQAAAAVAAAFLEGSDVPAEETEQPAVALPMTQVPSVPAPAAEAAVEPPAAPEAEPEDEPFDFSTLEPQLSPELAELLEDEPPDFEEEARAEVAAELQSAEDQGVYAEYNDPEQAARVRALEKRNQFLESRLVETNRGKWVQENLRAYPLVSQYAKDELEAVQATSRRAFAREAARLNERVTRIAKPLLADLQAKLATQNEAATAQARADVAAAWGNPAVDPAATGASAEHLERIRKARQNQNLSEVIKEMILPNPTGIL